jgi:hypothetical protein
MECIVGEAHRRDMEGYRLYINEYREELNVMLLERDRYAKELSKLFQKQADD